jgi:hypothetical protein
VLFLKLRTQNYEYFPLLFRRLRKKPFRNGKNHGKPHKNNSNFADTLNDVCRCGTGNESTAWGNFKLRTFWTEITFNRNISSLKYSQDLGATSSGNIRFLLFILPILCTTS